MLKRQTPSRAPSYTAGEEIANAVSHGVAALLAVGGTAVLLVLSAKSGDAFKTVSAAVYGGSMILLFVMSAMYHGLTGPRAKKAFRTFDHISIFVLIAGTYAPIALVALRGTLGYVIFGAVSAVAIVGIVLNAVSVERFRKFSMACYLAAGWTVAAAIVPTARAIGTGGTVFLFAGGLMYTAGVAFYRKKHIRYTHFVWHLFVLTGAVLHYFCVLGIILNG